MTKIQLPEELFGVKVKGSMEELLKEETQTSKPITQPTNINLDYKDVWIIEDNKYKILLSKSLIPSATQEQQINTHLTNQTTIKPASYPEMFLIGKMLYNNNTNKKDEILNFLRESFQKNWIQTSSGILYKSKGKDEIIHNKGMPSEYKTLVDFMGPDRYIEQADEIALEYLTELNSLDEVKEISKFLTSKNTTYLWRINNKPNSDTYRVASFLAYSAWAYLSCGRYPYGSSPALGVRVEKKI